MKAIVSDIHGNLEALQATLEDIGARGVEEVICLGDVIGYGPSPRECLDLMRDADVLILGNHEDAVLSGDAQTFNKRARRSVEWTRAQVLGEGAGGDEAASYAELFERFELSVRDKDDERVLYAHGSPRNPVKEYVTPRDAKNEGKMAPIFELIESVCFVGHTHVPGVFARDPDGEGFCYLPPGAEPGGVFFVSGAGEAAKFLVNVGSVGQPRDNDPRACYATFDMDTVVYHRVEYDVESVVAKVRASTALDNSLGERLRVGR